MGIDVDYVAAWTKEKFQAHLEYFRRKAREQNEQSEPGNTPAPQQQNGTLQNSPYAQMMRDSDIPV